MMWRPGCLPAMRAAGEHPCFQAAKLQNILDMDKKTFELRQKFLTLGYFVFYGLFEKIGMTFATNIVEYCSMIRGNTELLIRI